MFDNSVLRVSLRYMISGIICLTLYLVYLCLVSGDRNAGAMLVPRSTSRMRRRHGRWVCWVLGVDGWE